MAFTVFNEFKRALMNGEINYGSNTIKAILVMTNTTVDTSNDGVTKVSDMTLDEFDGANYARKTLSNKAVTKVDASDLAKWTADPLSWSALGAGTRQAQGILVYKHVTNDGDSIPLVWIQFPSNKTMDGSDFTSNWDSTYGVYAQT